MRYLQLKIGKDTIQKTPKPRKIAQLEITQNPKRKKPKRYPEIRKPNPKPKKRQYQYKCTSNPQRWWGSSRTERSGETSAGYEKANHPNTRRYPLAILGGGGWAHVECSSSEATSRGNGGFASITAFAGSVTNALYTA